MIKIAVASGKGGTGKTTLSTNLASYLAETKPVVLTDLDVEEPNSGLFINGELTHHENKYKMVPQWKSDSCMLCGNCREVCNFHAIVQLVDQIMVFPQLCHSCYACSELCPSGSLPMTPEKMGELQEYQSGNLHFIESKLDVGQEQAVPLIAQTLRYVDEKYSEVNLKIYDSPPGTSCPVIEATKNADLVILITEPTPFGLHDLKLAVETMRELNKRFVVVINRYGIGNDDVVDYCMSENITVAAKIPNSREIAGLYSQGRLLYNDVPEFKAELDKIVDFISDLDREVGL
ncbi:MAG: ATP-binding protein [Candidatus Marinimicrobia bacterium]|nr:ATP-binding protein [Candidatus Neomarinimicrobiota bacterium]